MLELLLSLVVVYGLCVGMCGDYGWNVQGGGGSMGCSELGYRFITVVECEGWDGRKGYVGVNSLRNRLVR